jgi:glycine hydroxymethyltransferase
MRDFLFRGELADLDPAVEELVQVEAERQARKLILIPSESTAPKAVRTALGSAFQNIYAEGYPKEDWRSLSEEEILDYGSRLGEYRRNADPRYYKGVEYADIVESLARQRCAEVFATHAFPAKNLFVNVQPLSGAPANNAVYTALLSPGDTILGMNLFHGGHLTHGSPVNRSGKIFNAVHYAVDPVTERIDYDVVQALANEHKPKIIIAGYSSYPWVPDWQRFRAIADSVEATLLADISHIAGMVAAGVIPSPVGIAQVVTFTTHKSLCGPRGACIITTDGVLARKIDRGVFPGEQGGPHIHAIAALATTFKLAQTDTFKELQLQIIKNAKALNDRLAERGLRIPFKGTDTHLTNIDCRTIVSSDGTKLSGDYAARILDLAGIVLNRNTIPGDESALNPSGIRLGTPWMTQRGLKEPEMIQVADIIADILQACTPFAEETRLGLASRARVDFVVFEDARRRVKELCRKAGIDYTATTHGYPHFFDLDDQSQSQDEWCALDLSGDCVREYVNFVFSNNNEEIKVGQSQPTCLNTPVDDICGFLTLVSEGVFRFSLRSEKFGLAATWLRDLSDGYVAFDPDVTRRIPGPVIVTESSSPPVTHAEGQPIASHKPYFIGKQASEGKTLPEFQWEEHEGGVMRRTPLYETHRTLGAKMVPFAGWEMPVWYTSVVEEHIATRQAAGLFDVTHMGVFQVEGKLASAFLDSVCANDIAGLAPGVSCYTHFLDPDSNVIDDLLVYRRGNEKYLVVVNASNDDKDWAWLNAVLRGDVLIDRAQPAVRAFGHGAVLRNLRDTHEGADMRVDLALQGPKSLDILLALGVDELTRIKITALKRTRLCEAVVGGLDLVVSRTGYTGEKMAFELFVHPDKATTLWNALLAVGQPMGLKACGLGARDSLRTEAGLPLYGHEMSGKLGLGVAEAGFGSYVKMYKPWFIGRTAMMTRERTRKGVVARFRFNDKSVRMAHTGDPVLDGKGRMIGTVTSCAIDSEGYLTGQAYVEIKSAVDGTPIWIFQGASKATGKAPTELKSGDRFMLPTPATIISRFLQLV